MKQRHQGVGVAFKPNQYYDCFSFFIERYENSIIKKEMEVELRLGNGKRILISLNHEGQYTAFDGTEKIAEGSIYSLSADMLQYKPRIVGLRAFFRV